MLFQFELLVVDFLELVQEPRIHRGHLGDLLHRVSLAQRVLHVGEALGMRRDQPLRQNLRLDLFAADALAGIERADALHQRFFEGAADGHHFADRFHLRTERVVGAGKFLELPLRNLHDHVIERRLEAGRSLARDVVGNFVERVADGEFRGNLGDREIRWPSRPALKTARRADSSR